MSGPPSQQRFGDFYPLGWVATNEKMTHRVLGVRAERVVAHGPAPRGFLIHGGGSKLWTAYMNGGLFPQAEIFLSIVRELAMRSGVDTAPVERTHARTRTTDLLRDFFRLCSGELQRPGRSGRFDDEVGYDRA